MMDGYEFPALDELFTPYDKLDVPQKPRINFVASILDLKILKNISYIVIKINISIYSGDL